MDVSLGRVFTDMRRFDSNGDGKISQSEAARAALNLQAQGLDDESALFTTLAAGGSDGGGLFPDFNGDGGVSFGEMAQLAAADGQGFSVSPDDFQAVFPDRFQDGGVDVDPSQLEDLANADRFNPFYTPQPPMPGFPYGGELLPGEGGSPYGISPLLGGGYPSMGSIPGLIQTVFSGLQKILGGGNPGNGLFLFLFGQNSNNTPY